MPSAEGDQRTILGIPFFIGTAAKAVERMKGGGLLVVPAAPALKDMETNDAYREALVHADLAIADSAYMVMIWNWLQDDSIRRLSGLEYLRELLKQPDVRQAGNVLWIMASPLSAERNLAWLSAQGIFVPEECVYLAPMYADENIFDPTLLDRIETIRPQHIVLTLGGGTQERVGLYLKKGLSFRPAIHCIGAAIAFLSEDSGLGGSKLFGMALSFRFGTQALRSAVLECTQTVVFVDSLSGTLACSITLGQYSNH
jgi:N-acetylglucosaminyldiphosphoundecaprenol N-acetyl-beta-D-mannosaminyltransferase